MQSYHRDHQNQTFVNFHSYFENQGNASIKKKEKDHDQIVANLYRKRDRGMYAEMMPEDPKWRSSVFSEEIEKEKII